MRLSSVTMISRVLFFIPLLLTACGGGTVGSTSSGTLSGVAAVGTPINGGTINVICAAGSALTTTTDSSGNWQTTLAGQTLPCAVEVSVGKIGSVPNSTTYHSIATSTGTVNVTPLTELLVANLTQSDPAAWYAGLSSSAKPLAVVNQSQVNAALSFLSGALPGLPIRDYNPITTSFTPVSGNVSDDMLTALKTALANNSSTLTVLLSVVSNPNFTAPTGLNSALTSAYANTASGSSSVSATANTTSQTLTVGTTMSGFTPLLPAGGTQPTRLAIQALCLRV